MPQIPDAFHDLFEKRSFAHFATLQSDGVPHVTPVWVDYDGEYVLVNTASGRQKVPNVEQHSAVALSIQDPDDPYRYLAVQGEVDEITEEGARDHIDELARRYWGVDDYAERAGQVGTRLLIKIRPDNVITYGE